jgi:hypothetical protein
MAPVMWTQMPALAGHQLLLLLAVLLGLLQLRLPRPRQQLRHAWCAQEACMHLPDGSLLLASPIGAWKVSAVREGQPSASLLPSSYSSPLHAAGGRCAQNRRYTRVTWGSLGHRGAREASSAALRRWSGAAAARLPSFEPVKL